ncbi:MAG TPA: hypothetical protein VFH63_02145 [candidate division Zixibacteria bacterium]|nr:hypothetical protein [candidate division Zixibacteria bacterium]
MTDRQNQPGYRGALPPRTDVLARAWVTVVIAAFVLIFVLSFLGLPGRLFPQETIGPLPSVPAASASAAPSGSAEASASGEASASEEASASPSGSPAQ